MIQAMPFSPYYRTQVAAAEQAIYQARLRAPIAHALLDDILDFMSAPLAKHLTKAEVAELEKYAVALADCGQLFNRVAYGDVTERTERDQRARLRELVAAAAGRR